MTASAQKITIEEEPFIPYVTVKETAAQLNVSGAFVTGEVKKLIGRGLLEKRADPEDRRKVRLTVTAMADDGIARLSHDLRSVNDAFFGVLSAHDFQALVAIIAGLAKSSGAAMEQLADWEAGIQPTTQSKNSPLFSSAPLLKSA